MKNLGYETKFSKYIAFRNKVQKRFIRAKTTGGNYTEELVEDRVLNKEKELGNIIDIKNNEKGKQSNGCKRWATKHSMTAVAYTMIVIRDKAFHSMTDLASELKRLSYRENELRK